jgi:formylmethanofuran dehydrogenase subunit E
VDLFKWFRHPKAETVDLPAPLPILIGKPKPTKCGKCKRPLKNAHVTYADGSVVCLNCAR